MQKPRILINLFHPHIHESRGNRILAGSVRDLQNVTFRNLYTEYPDFKINAKNEQQLLVDHDLIVFQHPFYWYNCPSLMKEWLDRVLEQGFAYPPGVGDKLNGKHWLTVLTTGGPEDAYRSGGFNNYTISELLRPFQQTANLCGMKWLPPLIVHSVLPEGIEGFKNITNDEIRKYAEEYKSFLDQYTIE
ncbi:NAD(P)H-dependent oxidoreductase [Desulfopila aestuarii]|uniref:Glutathione-regulated potassium-efflux system ancillary protein KefG n=1 Tax=Desulfopila aestuarii DSM 18488 TaxID=1121416 RepID=A0A1M7YMH5_9BACT|nr:NAD(P)H-dependent oxidoreductase [Desulfopila aestuarii]SHO53768.1 glutathione-regulated potassium-efflux system ancillary protein KefG [Desulfopila aestuarii DSM 18488]